MKNRRGILAWIEYLVIRSFFAVLDIFPVNQNLRTARLLARIWSRIMPRHRRRALEHLRASFPHEYTAEQIERIADDCLAHWTMFAMELVHAPRLLNKTSWPRYVEVVAFDETLELLLGGQGVILVTGHYGHFEVTGYLLACLGFDVVAVMRPLDNVYLNRFVLASRRSHGLELIDKQGAMLRAEKILQSGRALGFIADQDAGRKGIFVDFFGRPASTYKSIGLLAMRTGAPIVVGYARRLGDRFRYQVGIERIIERQEWEVQADPLHWITQTYTAAIESAVRAEPSQYLWIHRRWKTLPRPLPLRRNRACEPRQGSKKAIS